MPHARLFFWCFLVLCSCKEVLVGPPGLCNIETSSLEEFASEDESMQPPRDRYLVGIENSSVEEGKKFLEMLGALSVRPVLRAERGQKIYAITVPEVVADALRGNPWISYVEPVGIVRMHDDRSSPQGIDCLPVGDEFVPAGVIHMEAPDVWSQTQGEGVVAVMLDSGISVGHPDFADERILGGKCVRTDCEENPGDITDANGHGTHTAGTVGAGLGDFKGVVGMAPKVSFYIIKIFGIFGTASNEEVLVGMDEARQFAHDNPDTPIVVNMSFGGGATESMANALTALADEGVIIVASSGNSGDGNATTPETMLQPADHEKVFAIGAIDNDAIPIIADFSSNNEKVEFSAPGVNIMSDMPQSQLGVLSGTSMSAPHVTGAIALLLALDKKLDSGCNTQECIRNILIASVHDYGPEGRDIAFGYGEPRMNAAVEALKNRRFP